MTVGKSTYSLIENSMKSYGERSVTGADPTLEQDQIFGESPLRAEK
jgi:hypothetical protein